MRNTFIRKLEMLAEKDSAINLLVGDLGFSVIEKFQNDFPNRFHNIGVAEQNMIGIAAGMAHRGLRPYCYSIANFPVFRPAEFIRNLLDYHNLDVTIVAVGGGLAYGNLGYTHHAVQDFAFFGSLQNFTIMAPADPSQVSLILDFAQALDSPKYLRLNRNNEAPLVWDVHNISQLPYFSCRNQEPDQKSIVVSTGYAGSVFERYVRKSLAADRFPDAHLSIPVWGPNFKPQIYQLLSRYDEVHVFEDHVTHGGFSQWLKALMPQVRILTYSLVDEFINRVGSQDYFTEQFIKSLENSND